MFDADRPIASSEQDRLGRATFAKYLARCVLDHNSAESLVIGLYGGWGVGKTSVINLTLEELRFAASNMFDDEKPIILNFSPWSYSGQDQLVYSFFRRLSSEMRASPYFENANKIIHLLELYVSFFTHKPVPVSLRPKHTVWGAIFKSKGMTEETLGWESGRDLTQVKAELNELLRQQKHKIIIMIDNITRLEDHEIKQVFQIVKSMGDYANTIYMLALDKEHIIRTFERQQRGTGVAYLEKVVQLPFEIPPISQQDLELIFTDRLQKILHIVPFDAWNKDYWADLYYTSLKHFFMNVRDITRYVNSVSFSYAHVKEVVNPVDFFAITALEVFAPEIYYGIRDNKDLFTDLMDHVYVQDAVKIAEDKSRCDEILKRGEKILHDQMLQLLIRLFPRLRTLYEADVAFYHSDIIARNDMRICNPDIFDVYFRLSMPLGLIPPAEMNTILAIAPDAEGFDLALMRLNQDGKIIKFLDWLDSEGVKKIHTDHIGNVMNALMDSADLFPEGVTTPVSFNTPMRIHRIFTQLLSRFDQHEKRYGFYREAIKKATNSLYIIVHEFNLQSDAHIETADTFVPSESRDLTPKQLENWQTLAMAKISEWATTGRLIEHPKLIPILFFWKGLEEGEACHQYVVQITQEEKGLLAFLCGVLKEPIDQAMAKYEKNPEWKKYIATIEDFISVEFLAPQAILLFEGDNFEKLREREQLAILIFLDLINAKTTKVIPMTSV